MSGRKAAAGGGSSGKKGEASAAPKGAGAAATLFRVSVYSPKALLLTGDTFAHRGALKGMGGRWNPTLKGWVFSRRSRTKELNAWVKRMGGVGCPECAGAGAAASASGKGKAKAKRPSSKQPSSDSESEGEAARGKKRRRLRRPVAQQAKQATDSDDEVVVLPSRLRERKSPVDYAEDKDERAGTRKAPVRRARIIKEDEEEEDEWSDGSGGGASSSAGSSEDGGSWASDEEAEDEEDGGGSDDSDEEDEDYEGESDSEEEEDEGEERDLLRGGSASSASAASAAKGSKRRQAAIGKRGIPVQDVAEHILGRLGLGSAGGGGGGGGGGSGKGKAPAAAAKKAKPTAAASKAAEQKRRQQRLQSKRRKREMEDEDAGGADFPELLPTTARSGGARGGRGKAGASSLSSPREQARQLAEHSRAAASLGRLASLPHHIILEKVAPCLGQNDLGQMHMVNKTLTRWLDDPRAWAHISMLDMRYETLAVRQSSRGRTRVQPMDITILQIMRVLGQARFREAEGLDLRGMELGAERKGKDMSVGAPLMAYILEKCPRVKRLLLQGPGDSHFGWSQGGVERAIAASPAREHIEELGLELEHVNSLKALIKACPRLATLRLGSRYESRRWTAQDWERLFAPEAAKGGARATAPPPQQGQQAAAAPAAAAPPFPALTWLEVRDQPSFGVAQLALACRRFPKLRHVTLWDCEGRRTTDRLYKLKQEHGLYYIDREDGMNLPLRMIMDDAAGGRTTGEGRQQQQQEQQEDRWIRLEVVEEAAWERQLFGGEIVSTYKQYLWGEAGFEG